MRWGRRILGALLVLFLLFYLINQPVSAANAVRAVFGALARAFNSLLVFSVTSLDSGGRSDRLARARHRAASTAGLGRVRGL